jgi:chromosome segregation ATPase
MNYLLMAWNVIKGASGFVKLLNPWLWLGVALVVIGGFVGFRMWTNSLIEQGRQEVRAEVAAITKAQEQAAADITANLEAQKNEAIAQAEERAKRNAVAAAGARRELDRLRAEIGSTEFVAADSCTAAIDRAAALGELLGECSERYTEVAEKADRHSSDAAAFLAAWPDYRAFQAELEAFKSQLKGIQ